MRIGISLRTMGDAARADLLGAGVSRAERLGLDAAWVVDHIAIPPDDAEGSGGTYLDPLATLAWLAGQTRRIHLGTAVLILPYRAALPTAKVLATVQALSGDRLVIGTGIGWMKAEFRAVGVPIKRRARIADATLAFFRHCFANEVVQSHGQPLLFRPRPKAPPFLVGGAAPHAIERALALGDGWLPMGLNPAKLAPLAADYRRRAAELGLPVPRIATFLGGPRDLAEARELVRAFAAAGVTDLIVSGRYQDAAGQASLLDFAASLLETSQRSGEAGG